MLLGAISIQSATKDSQSQWWCAFPRDLHLPRRWQSPTAYKSDKLILTLGMSPIWPIICHCQEIPFQFLFLNLLICLNTVGLLAKHHDVKQDKLPCPSSAKPLWGSRTSAHSAEIDHDPHELCDITSSFHSNYWNNCRDESCSLVQIHSMSTSFGKSSIRKILGGRPFFVSTFLRNVVWGMMLSWNTEILFFVWGGCLL